MKTKNPQTLVALFLMLLSISAWSKDEEEMEAPAPTRSEMLTGRNWSITAYSVEPAVDADGNGTQENNLMPYLPACVTDDFTDLNANQSYTAEEGDSKCEPNDPEVFETGDWSFNSAETLVVFSPDGQASYELSIESLSSGRW